MDLTCQAPAESAQASGSDEKEDELEEEKDQYREERESLYKQHEQQHQEELAKVNEQVVENSDLVEKYEKEMEETTKEGDKNLSTHMDIISEEAGQGRGPVYDDLSKSYKAHMSTGVKWPDEDYDKCAEAIEKESDDLRKHMEEEAERAMDRQREEAQMEERNLEESYLEKEEEVASQIESTKAEYDDRLNKETDPDEKEKITQERDKALEELTNRQNDLQQKYEEDRKELSKKNKAKMDQAKADAEFFVRVAQGDKPFETPEANRKFQESKQAFMKSDHKEAVANRYQHIAQKKRDRAVKKRERLVEKTDKEDVQARTKVMKEQVNAAPNEETREKIRESVNAELDEGITKTKEELKNTEVNHANKTYGLAKEKKRTKQQAKTDTDILKKRVEKYRKTQTEIDAEMDSASHNKKQNLAREKEDLERAAKVTEKEIQRIQENADKKQSDLESQYQTSRKEYEEQKQRLENKLVQLETAKSEMQTHGKQPSTNTGQAVDDVNQPIQDMDIDNTAGVGPSPKTARQRQGETEVDNETEVLTKRSKQDTTYNKPAKRNINRLTNEELKDLNKMKQAGRNLSTTEKPNKVRHGDTHIYDVNNIDELKNTDNTKWEKVTHAKTAGTGSTGKGTTRRWTAKGDPDMTKHAHHYPDANLGVVRYNSKKESDKYGKGKSAPEQQDGSKRFSEAGTGATRSDPESNRTTRGNDEAVASPIKQTNHKTPVDDYNLSKIVQKAKPDELQDPASQPIKEPTGGDLYVYKMSGRENEEKAVKDDNLRWQKNREHVTQNYKKEVYYTKDKKQVNTGFQKHVYTSHDGTRMAVHYVGDASLSVPKQGRFSRPEVKDRQPEN